ncbi:uncharacterized protein [Manis javanica]|uniref:uncharacterized protein n=2 Tax=Manis javanica TaxID=9974 RepID=UPI003C6D3DB6
MRSCCAEPSEGVGVREAERESLPTRCGRWLSDLLHRLCPCLRRSPEPEHEPTVHGTEVPRCRAPWTGVRRKWRKRTARVEPAPNTSRSSPEATLPPEDANQPTHVQEKEGLFRARRLSSGATLSRNACSSLLPATDADQPATGPLLPRSRPGSITGDAVMAPSCDEGHDEGPEEDLRIPRMGRARRLAWEPQHVPSVIDASELSSILVGQVLHHLVQEEHLGPAVAELEEAQQRQLAPETQGGSASWVEPVQELPATPVLELRPVSPASASAEPEDVPAVASAPGPGPKLEPHQPLGTGPGAPAWMAQGLTEPEVDPAPTRPRAMSHWDIPGVVSGPELEPHEPSGPGPMAPARIVLGLAEPEADLEPTRPCAMNAWGIPGVASRPELEPHEPSGPGPVAPAGTALGLAEPEADPEPTSPCSWSTWDEPGEEEPTILAFPPSLVAEQLTLICAELYSRIEFGECKTYLESQPLMEGIELLAPNIHNIMRQFDATFYFVTSSCLRAPSLMAQDRARVVEFWIQVAKECLDLRNFESLHAILCALQCRAVCRLDSTWGHVSWKSFWSYKKLQKRDHGLNGKQLLEEARATVRRRRQAPYRYLDGKTQGIVPFLGYFLRDVPIDQLSKYNEDVSDPARHRRASMVTLIGREIMMHKRVAALYDLEPDERFLSFFQTEELLDEEKSYHLSCQLEASGQWAGMKELLQFFRSHKI